MKKSGWSLSLLLLAATVTFAQGPGGRGPHGFGGMGGGFGGLISAGPGSRTPVTGAPYSAVQTTTIQQKLADGNIISRQETTKVYRDSQGRVRMEHTVTPPNSTTAETRISIFDPVGGFSYMLNPTALTAVKVALPAATTTTATATTTTPTRPARPGVTVTTEDLGTQVINGVPATGTRTTETIAAGTIGNQAPIAIVREVWTSTILKVPVQIKTSDPRFGTTTMELTNIVQAEPEASLFQVPSNYTVTTRSGGHGPGGFGFPGSHQ